MAAGRGLRRDRGSTCIAAVLALAARCCAGRDALIAGLPQSSLVLAAWAYRTTTIWIALSQRCGLRRRCGADGLDDCDPMYRQGNPRIRGGRATLPFAREVQRRTVVGRLQTQVFVSGVSPARTPTSPHPRRRAPHCWSAPRARAARSDTSEIRTCPHSGNGPPGQPQRGDGGGHRASSGCKHQRQGFERNGERFGTSVRMLPRIPGLISFGSSISFTAAPGSFGLPAFASSPARKAVYGRGVALARRRQGDHPAAIRPSPRGAPHREHRFGADKASESAVARVSEIVGKRGRGRGHPSSVVLVPCFERFAPRVLTCDLKWAISARVSSRALSRSALAAVSAGEPVFELSMRVSSW